MAQKNRTSIFSFSGFGIYRKVLLLTLAISLTPILIFAIYTMVALDRTGGSIVDETESAVDEKVRQSIELQAVLTANSVSRFLKQRENNLFDFANLIPTEKHYLDFYKLNNAPVWRVKQTDHGSVEEFETLPMFKELALINQDGQEIIKVIDGRLLAKSELRNVSNPANTTYLNEDYFNQAAQLNAGEIYVSHLNGFYISETEQIKITGSEEKIKQSPVYNGVVRMATPLYDGVQFRGIVMLAIDHQHLMEFTQHILPNSKEQVVFPNYYSGNYAFMFDDRGWIITHPKLWDLPGIDSVTKQMVPAYKQTSSDEDKRIGRIPFNLDTAGFVHPNYPIVAEAVRRGESGSVITTNIGGVTKVMAYAPIIYNTGQFKKYGVFGGITIGAELQQFRQPIASIAEEVSHIITLFRNNIIFLIIFTILLTVLASWLLSRNLTEPILTITDYTKKLADGETITQLKSKRNDEIGVLAETFNFMASELEKSNAELRQSLESLKQSKDEIENYNLNLEYQISIFKSIQRISNILGSSTDLDSVLKIILKSCIESLKFDRAVLYLLDSSGRYLEYSEMHGLDADEEARAKRSVYDLDKDDCIETRVVKTGEIIYVNQFDSYPNKTEFDRVIHRFSKSDSFVYVPLKVKERIIGVMGADRLRSQGDIREIDINSLQILANQASRIIENTRLYQEIMQQRDFVENIIRNMIKGVVTTDSKGVVTTINHAAKNILRWQDIAAIGQPYSIVCGNFQTLSTELEKIIAENHREATFKRELKIEENERFLSVSISTIRSTHSSEAGLIILLEDETEKKLLDDHLHHLDRLALMGRFAAGIAHEIRNPLTGISVFLDDMHDKVSGQPEYASFIKMAVNEIERLENLVNELLDYATPSETVRTISDLNQVIESSIHFVEKEARKAGVKISVNYAQNLPGLPLNDDKIRQALLNILLNAIQHMPDGGEILISTNIIGQTDRFTPIPLVSDPSRQSWLKIIIEDSGPGLKAEDLSRIFEPFYTKRRGGTGLGLSITQSIIAEHDGKIMAGKAKTLTGACFTIYLPTIQKKVLAESKKV